MKEDECVSVSIICCYSTLFFIHLFQERLQSGNWIPGVDVSFRDLYLGFPRNRHSLDTSPPPPPIFCFSYGNQNSDAFISKVQVESLIDFV